MLCQSDHVTEDFLPWDIKDKPVGMAHQSIEEASPESMDMHAQVEALEKKLLQQALLKAITTKPPPHACYKSVNARCGIK